MIVAAHPAAAQPAPVTLSRFLAGLGVLALWLGYFFRPWIPSSLPALVLNGFDLAERLTFLPEVQAGALPISRLQQTLPLAALLILTVAFAAALRRWPRWALIGLAGIGLFGVLPGYPFILFWRSDATVQQQLLLTALTVLFGGLLFALTLFAHRLPPRLRRAPALLTLSLALAAAALAAVNLATLLPVFSALYARPLPPGDGLWLYLLGTLLTALAALRDLTTPH